MSVTARITRPVPGEQLPAVPSMSWLLADTQQQLKQALAVQHLHLAALRTISQALGNPLQGATDKTALDLAMLAAETITSQAARIAELEARS